MSGMHIAFRTDATNQIGTGHFMRCLTLAIGLKQSGAHIRFVSRGLPMHLSDLLTAKGIELTLLSDEVIEASVGDLAHSHWLAVSQTQDAQATIQALSDISWDWLVVDHYALDALWEKALRPTAKKIMVIDDIADRQHECDVLLDQNLYIDMHTRYAEKVPVHCQQLIGPSYALLRDEFRKMRAQVEPRTDIVRNILVFYGGVDADNYTGLTIEALSGLALERVKVNVVIGAQHPNKFQIEEACLQKGYVCHVQTNKMAKLIVEADICIGAGGSATWERCALGLPTITFPIAENQENLTLNAAKACMIYAPIIEEDVVNTIRLHIKALSNNPTLRNYISNNAMKLVDGLGVSRVIEKLSLK